MAKRTTDTTSEPDGNTADDSAHVVLRKRLEALESQTILTIQDGAEIARLRKALTQE